MPGGLTGESYTISPEIPDYNDDMEFIWRLTSQPEESYLQIQDIPEISKSKISFLPDVAGLYTFELSVYQYNDEISTESFEIIISPMSADLDLSEDDSEELPEDDNAVTELLLDDKTSETGNWYDEDEKQEDLEMETIEVQSEKIKIPVAKKIRPVKILNKSAPVTSIPYDKNRYTIQVTSKNDLQDAKIYAASLMDSGYDAYIQKAIFQETNKIWYRVRIGSYANLETAKAVAKTISDSKNEKAWVDFVRYEN